MNKAGDLVDDANLPDSSEAVSNSRRKTNQIVFANRNNFNAERVLENWNKGLKVILSTYLDLYDMCF